MSASKFFRLLVIVLAAMLTAGELTVLIEPRAAAQMDRREAVVVSLYPEGFQPAEATQPAGPFLLVFHDQTGLDEVNLVIDRAAGTRLVSDRLFRGDAPWTATADLPPGTYLISEADHPDWVFRLVITAR